MIFREIAPLELGAFIQNCNRLNRWDNAGLNRFSNRISRQPAPFIPGARPAVVETRPPGAIGPLLAGGPLRFLAQVRP
jgi:hypothetical protein